MRIRWISSTVFVPVVGSMIAQSALAAHGFYRVPVPKELETAATYTVDNVLFKRRGDRARLFYSLPEELVGSADEYSGTLMGLEGIRRDGAWEMKGPQANGRCQESRAGLNCFLRYNDLGIDVPRVRDSIKQKYALNPKLRDQKLMVLARFSTEPIGILFVPR